MRVGGLLSPCSCIIGVAPFFLREHGACVSLATEEVVIFIVVIKCTGRESLCIRCGGTLYRASETSPVLGAIGPDDDLVLTPGAEY